MPTKKGKGKSRASSPKRRAKFAGDAHKITAANVKLPVLVTPRAQALQSCVASSDTQALARLVVHYNHESALSAVDSNGSTTVHLACRKADTRMLSQLLQYNAVDLNIREKRIVGGYTALHHACSTGCVEAIRLLLSRGADVNVRADSPMGELPLHVCCKMGQVESARILLLAGAYSDARDNFGNNASFWALQKQHGAMIPVLGLPQSKSASPDEYLKLLLEKNSGNFVLPSLKVKKKKKKDGKGGGKTKSKK